MPNADIAKNGEYLQNVSLSFHAMLCLWCVWHLQFSFHQGLAQSALGYERDVTTSRSSYLGSNLCLRHKAWVQYVPKAQIVTVKKKDYMLQKVNELCIRVWEESMNGANGARKRNFWVTAAWTIKTWMRVPWLAHNLLWMLLMEF